MARHEDPIRAQRPTYALADPFLQFHYAVLGPHRSLFRDRQPRELWVRRLAAVFDSRVRGPVFEDITRTWVRRYAAVTTLGGPADHIGRSSAVVEGVERELDLVVAGAEDAATPPSDRPVHAIGEAKAGETAGPNHLRALETARTALGPRAAHAKILLFAAGFTQDLQAQAANRADVELVDLDRLYHGE